MSDVPEDPREDERPPPPEPPAAEESPTAPEPPAEPEPPAGPEPSAEQEPPAEPAAPATWAGRERAEREGGKPEDAAPRAEPPAAKPGPPPPPPPPGPPSREQSTEAALAGVRARAAAERSAATASGGVDEPAHRPPSTPRPAAKPPESPPAATDAEDGRPPRARPLWARFLAASLIIVFSIAAATAVSALVLLKDIARGFGGIPGLQGQLENVGGGEPQTILILGSDKRPTDDTGRSDTTMLLRVDPDRKAIALLSIPRDLKVNIPNHGVDKFNAAYSYGGPKLTLEVVKQLTGLKVNHVVNINFTGFADAVNAIGCVYIDVDRRYFIPPESGIAEIDIEAGYQRLCGLKALQYVRYRHTDSDLVRAARQQDFLREARQKIEPSKLVFDRSYRYKLLDIFKRYTTSDEALRDPIAVLELMKTFIGARNAPVSEVHFPAQLGDANAIYVTADEDAIENAVEQFLGTQGTPGPAPTGEGGAGANGGDEGGGGAGGGAKKPKPKPDEPEGPAMIDVTGVAEQHAAKIAATKRKDGDPMIDFPILYPTRLTPPSTLNDASRAFVIDGPSKDVYHGYKFVAGFQGAGGFTEYYGVSGTSWEDPPILENPSETREIGGREYLLFYDRDRLRLVGFKEKGASYWVINTLTQTLGEEQMMAIAASLAKRDPG